MCDIGSNMAFWIGRGSAALLTVVIGPKMCSPSNIGPIGLLNSNIFLYPISIFSKFEILNSNFCDR